MRQERFRFGLFADAEQLYHRVRNRIEQVASAIGKGEVASQLEMPFSTFSNALRERQRSSLKAVHLVAMILMDDGDTILGELAAAKGYDLVRRVQLSPEERLDLLSDRIRRRFGEAGEDLLRELER